MARSTAETEKIVRGFQSWADAHPMKGLRLLLLGTGRSLTPQDLANEVARGTALGEAQMQAIELIAKHHGGLDAAIAILVSSVDRPALPGIDEPGGPVVPQFRGGRQGYTPPPPDPALWHWVEKADNPPMKGADISGTPKPGYTPPLPDPELRRWVEKRQGKRRRPLRPPIE